MKKKQKSKNIKESVMKTIDLASVLMFLTFILIALLSFVDLIIFSVYYVLTENLNLSPPSSRLVTGTVVIAIFLIGWFAVRHDDILYGA